MIVLQNRIAARTDCALQSAHIGAVDCALGIHCRTPGPDMLAGFVCRMK